MATLTVGVSQQFSKIADAVNASSGGDTIDIQAGTYTNDFVQVSHDLTLEAVGGSVVMDATAQPPDGKAILTEGASGETVNINGITFEGATVPDANGAGIRYEGGILNIENSSFFNNQNGILGAADPSGKITIDRSDFGFNGVGGDGHTHNIYVGAINELDVTNSYVHDANVGHEIKSRAANNVITGNTIADNGSSASYSIDLPNGGNATITNNQIEKGANSGNPNVIAMGEEGASNATSSIVVDNNTILNDRGSNTALWNATGTTAKFSNNSVYGFGDNSQALVNGPATQNNTTVLASEPSITQAVLSGATSTPTPVATPTPTATTGLVVNVSEDAFQGDAQFTIILDGQQQGGTYTTTALHGAGQSQAISLGDVCPGQHQVGVTFLNDAYAGTPETDRNLYVDGAAIDGEAIPNAATPIYSAGTDMFGFDNASQVPINSQTATSSNQGATPITSNVVINVSEDAWQGDAQFTVAVDGRQVDGVYTATASHVAGASQAISVSGIAEMFQPHDIAVTFVNDAYGGTAQMDRNLYVNSIQIDNQNVPGASATMLWSATDRFNAMAPANWTGQN